MTKSLIIFFISISATLINNSTNADQKDPRLSMLFTRLLTVSPGPRSIALENDIWKIWLETEDQAIQKLMKTGDYATQENQLQDALKTYTQVLQKDPNFAEAWNKRALTYYLMGNYTASLSDIRKTLTLEPRHFGALSGQGLIYSAQNKWTLAKRVFRKALEIHPTMRGPRINLSIIEKQEDEEEA
ncbi:tetratricopeptide repeat protein [Kiloniella antarctica]|uniref:Tetratricopeptide repeat protein n=1 Tax=Kiloniella antarctica TaxID=1550907 RepID=A0ABW5BQU4_9PROT